MVCSKCKVDKPDDKYPHHATGKRAGKRTGRICKQCKVVEFMGYYNKDPNEGRAKQRRWRQNNPEKYKTRHLRKTYGITLEQYQDLHRKQNGVCAICSSGVVGGNGEDLYVDHDHATGVVRGLLCNRCNLLIGYARDDSGIAERAAAYLRKHKL